MPPATTKVRRPKPHGIAAHLSSLAVPVGDLKEDPENARLHPQRNLDAIRASLQKFGQQRPVLATKEGVVVAGNGTLRTAVELGWTHVAAVRTSLTGEELRAYAIADNKTGELAEWNWEKLSEQLRELAAHHGKDKIEFTGFADFEIEPLLKAVWTPPPVSGESFAVDGAKGDAEADGSVMLKFAPEQWKRLSRWAKARGLDSADRETVARVVVETLTVGVKR